MSASKALALSTTGSRLAQPTALRRHRRLNRRQRETPPAAPGTGISLLSISLVAGVSLTLALLACCLVVTGLVVWVANGASEWLAAAVPALLAVLLFALALRLTRLLHSQGGR
ncbi:MAG: hypothetical protein JNN30_10270 [Rhodanobacteraceae bacterium]|nr:hypothetical protein [Rhodanobacteraceae bacterium]